MRAKFREEIKYERAKTMKRRGKYERAITREWIVQLLDKG